MTAIILDCETTGLKDPEPIEVAWVEVLNPRQLVTGRSFYRRYRPSKKIELGALATHHILDEDLVDCAPASEFALPEGVEYLVGHHIDYDWETIGKPEVKRIDTLPMAWRLWPEVDQLSQAALLYHLDRAHARERLAGAHNAMQDVRVCLTILGAICDSLPEVQSWEDLWRFSEEARVPLRWPFGKHRGQLIAEAPPDYLEWVLLQDGMDEYVKTAAKRALTGAGRS